MSMRRQFRLPGFGFSLTAHAGSIFISDRSHHLRSGAIAEWDEFADRVPEGRRLDLEFQGRSNAEPGTLLIRQDDVKLDWRVELNGKKVGQLFLMESPLTTTFA